MRRAQDVLKVLAGLLPPAFTPEFLDGPLPQGQLARVRQPVSPHPMPIDEIAWAAGLNSAQCQAVLMEFELAGEVLSCPGRSGRPRGLPPVACMHRPRRQKQGWASAWLDDPVDQL